MKMKKLMAGMLALIMVVGLLPTAFADNSIIVYGETGNGPQNRTEVAELRNDAVADNWEDIKTLYDVRHANIYLWYNAQGNIAKANDFLLYCTFSLGPDGKWYASQDEAHQLAIEMVKNDSETAYRYLIGEDVSWEEVKGETAKPAPTPTPTPTNPATTTPVVDITFVDVNEGDWYYEAVMALAHAGILNGKGNGIFDPNAEITVGEMCALICRLDMKVNPVAFEPGETLETYCYDKRTFNQPTSWAHEYIMGVRKYGGTNSNLYHYPRWDPEAFAEPVRRGEAMAVCCGMAARMTRYVDIVSSPFGGGKTWGSLYRGWENAVSVSRLVPNFNNEGHMLCDCSLYVIYEHSWGSSDVGMAYALNIAHGVDDKGTANAHGNLTRAEFCQMLYNMGVKDGNTINNHNLIPDIKYTVPKTVEEWRAMWEN